MKIIKSTLVVLIIFGIVGLLNLLQEDKKSIKTATIQATPTIEQTQHVSNRVVDATIDVINALGNYYVATQNDINGNSEIVEMMTSLLNANKYLESGNGYVEKYMDDSNEVIQITVKGMVAGANGVIKANNELINFMRSKELTDYEYAIAKFISNQKEGYKYIAISAPQITSLLFEPAKSNNPTGKIPYTISKDDRVRIQKEINRLFGNDLAAYKADIEKKTGKYNTILFTVNAINNNLIPETYEEAKLINEPY